MGGHDHHKPYHVPDHTVYKLENAPELIKVQEKLAQEGLKDPWLRNEIWRYDVTKWGTFWGRGFRYATCGFKLGIPLFLLTIGLEKAFGIEYGHGHSHDHGSHDGEHDSHH
ncbi:NADH dehydrogenase [ubiquinone] 1 beta subcomplex subunit 3 [Diprion similis]|uniref:NADH dehydrogenase [ubiquinone] 1 beta subcomplex subunit 3 n=1 Tax=Diprion similis TaxID=362088 RepID=UPI001EF77F97|nr:NADH dehydrogenase [ubiquinone] 1 beta subcomplex subunit 3 [Diprion similis]